ncbi:MAG: hypothetical protein KAU16_08280 [Methanophagales archaeon]|nr:hypothetical protein [Methanophagales archaeon]
MAVEALKLIREGEEEGRKLIEEAKESAAKLIKDADKEVNRIKEKAREDEKSLAVQISDKYAKEGGEEEKAIMKDTVAEAEKLKTIAESNLDSTVNVVLEKILGLG